MNNSNHFEIKSELSEVKVMARNFQNFCNNNHVDKDISGLLELALVESLNNIIIHAYDKVGGHDIRAHFEKSASQVIITLTDFGKEFKNNKDDTQSEKPDPANLELDQLAEGSWGIDLINTISDEIIQHRKNNSNILIIKKNISA